MDQEQEDERKSRNKGLFASISIHSVILMLLFLLAAWRAPNPPNPEYGVEINLGFSPTGGGDIQPETEVGDEGQDTETNAQAQEVPQEQAQEETVQQQQEEVVTDNTNPVSVREEKQEVKQEVKKETTKMVETKPKEEKKVVNQEALFTPKETNEKTSTQKKGESLSQGNDKNATGDKGQPDGTLDPNAQFSGLKGGGAGGSGAGLDLAGWRWKNEPRAEVQDNESGRLVFEIEVDENGDIVKLVTLERGLSAQTEKRYRDEILKLEFARTGANVPEISKGKITISVKAQ